MEESKHSETVGSSFPVTAIVAAAIGCAVIIIGGLGYLSMTGKSGNRAIVIATGPETGTYHALGTAFGRLLEAEAIVGSANVLITEGSAENMNLIGGEGGRADFALVQSDTRANPQARLVASLYEEHLHVLVARDIAPEIQSIYDLHGLRVSLGGIGSGTRQVARLVLAHFKTSPSADLAIPPAGLADAFAADDLDAAFILTAIPSETIEVLARGDLIRFLPLGDAQEVGNEADALALVHPSLHATVIPHSTYGRFPERPILTIGVTAQLVASRRVEDSLVRQVTETLFEQRSNFGAGGEKLAAAQRIRERYSPGASPLPYHPGAAAYYTRRQPPFLVEYAETMSLLLTVMVGLYSAYIAFREWARRRRKNRIDAFYVEATRHFDDVLSASEESLAQRYSALVALRRKAFKDLIDERLDANESFTILQDQIDSELRSIEALISTKSG